MPANVASATRVVIVTPAPRGSSSGNRVTALRWAALLRQLGAQVRIRERWGGEPCQLLIALHAVKSADSALAATAALPGLRLVVLLAGTDVYPHFEPDPTTLAVLERADALIGLQALAAATLPASLRQKVRTIVQSAQNQPSPRNPVFRACVLAHLRAVKDPLLPLLALQRLPTEQAFELVFAGRAMTAEMEQAMRTELRREPRARWVGELRRRAARELLASSHVCIVPSSAEGGPNVISEAIASGTPVLATAIPGNLGLLGADWPGAFPAGDVGALAALMRRAASDVSFYRQLLRRTAALSTLVEPQRELAAFRVLLQDLGLKTASPGPRAGP